MIILVVICLASCGLALVLTPLVRRLALRIGLVDRPDGRRKVHGRVIPVAGGLAVLLAFILTLALALAWGLPESSSDDSQKKQESLLVLLLGSVAICALGVADDFGCLRGRHKLLGQALIASVMALCVSDQVQKVSILGAEFKLGMLSFPFTALFLLGAINSLNLIDGMDGLLSSVGIILSLALTVMAVLTGHIAMACVTAALAGSLLGFLRYNFPPASIFLGDAGSMLIGLVLGVLAIENSLKTSATVVLAAPLGLLTVPMFDTTAAILRRKLTGRSIYSTDRGHLHHCLLRQGWSIRRTLLIISCFCLLTSAGALVSLALAPHELSDLPALVSGLAVVAILVAARLFGHAELALVLRRLTAFASSLAIFPSPGRGREYEIHLQGTAEWGKLWDAIIACSEELNLQTACLDINMPAVHENYHARWDRGEEEPGEVEACWRAELPLTVRGQVVGHIQVTGRRDEVPIYQKIATLAKLDADFEVRAALLTDIVFAKEQAHARRGPHFLELKHAQPAQVAEPG
jgi:UDP-GlcNAc:undecaprenyl-phosphate GlcNAc-1-phosphate transferase